MSVPNVGPAYSTTTTATTSSGASKKSVDDIKNQYLQMLIAQMKNQDPLSPSDPSEFTRQMMQMGQLEQLFSLNENISTLVNTQSGALIAQYAGMVGHQAQAYGEQLQISGEDKGVVQFDLKTKPSTTSINVFDSFGNLKRTFTANISNSGSQIVSFDGKDSLGADLPDGYYSYQVQALDQSGSPIAATTYSNALISSVRLENGTPIFQMGSEDVEIGDVLRVF